MASTSHSHASLDLTVIIIVLMTAADTTTARVRALCGKELGMKSGDIKNDQITASSIHSDDWEAFYARLDNEDAWYPSSDDENQWLQIDLRKKMVITGVVIQGHATFVSGSYYVRTFKLQCNRTHDWQDAFGGMLFQGNNDAHGKKYNNFATPIVTSAIRFLPVTWHNGIALRVELLGCNLSDIKCGEPPTIPNTVIMAGHSGTSYGEWRKYRCTLGFTSPVPEHHLICGINGTWYWTGDAPHCTRTPTAGSPTVATLSSSTESTGNTSAGTGGTQRHSKGPSSVIAIAAGVAGGLVVLVVIIVVVTVCRRRRRDKPGTRVTFHNVRTPPYSGGSDERPEEVGFVQNILYQSVENSGAGENRLEEGSEDGFVRNNMYESVAQAGEDPADVTLLSATSGAVYSTVNKRGLGADDAHTVENIIYE